MYDAFSHDNAPIKLVRHGKEYDGGYVVPTIALEKADALMGYGIDTDISFEDEFSRIYQKPSFGFDCGIEGIKTNHELTTFVRQCIANDKSKKEKP